MDDDTGTNTALRPTRLRSGLAMGVCALVAVCWFVWGPVGIITYVGGLFNYMAVFFIIFLLVLPILVGSVAFLVLGVSAVVTWRRRSIRNRRALAVWLVLTGGLGCPFLVGLIGLTGSPFDLFVRGFFRYAERRVDVEAIQDWLGTLDSSDESHENGMVDGQLGESERPPCIAELAPRFVMVRPDSAGRPTVRLIWGSGFIGSWGIEVGPVDMPTPPSDSSSAGERRLPLQPGAYVWSGD